MFNFTQGSSSTLTLGFLTKKGESVGKEIHEKILTDLISLLESFAEGETDLFRHLTICSCTISIDKKATERKFNFQRQCLDITYTHKITVNQTKNRWNKLQEWHLEL